MNYVLLLGAGFSRNWGGWLAPEAFEYLLGCPQIDAGLRDLLWRHRTKGGFEAALSELQDEHFRSRSSSPEPRLANLQDAIVQMFKDMDDAFGESAFEFQNSLQYTVRKFLVRFDAIFTLNQDLLLERHYLNSNVGLGNPRHWDDWQIPGMKRIASPSHPLDNPNLGSWTPEPSSFRIAPRKQPYFKLHGSSNWVDPDGQGLLVLGGNKLSAIERHPILKWNFSQFREYLSPPDTRLMVIGYSFGDDHINSSIRAAAGSGRLEIFLIDPNGVDVVDKNKGAMIHSPDELAKELWPRLCGTSRRSLRETFGSDRAEHGKVMRFFS